MKTFNLIVSRTFPSTHKRKGEQTFFPEKILNAIGKSDWKWQDENFNVDIEEEKYHTIRANYSLWEKRIKQVQEGKAEIRICYWEQPGGMWKKGNRMIEVCRLGKDDGVGVQKINFDPIPYHIELSDLAKADGLTEDDMKSWFKGYDLSEPLAIIHFTKFRYS